MRDVERKREKCLVVKYGERLVATSKGLNSIVHYLRTEALSHCEV